MKISRKWLSQYMDVSDLSAAELAEKITDAGFEVESYEPLSAGDGLVIGEVLSCQDHPDSDHLHCTSVDVGDEVLEIVCGAPNVAAGQKVIVARPGARLPGGTIKAGKIRGQNSNGMICALFELGVDRHLLRPEQVAGIEVLPEDAPVGHADPLGWLGWKDDIFDISLTPNRTDCLAAFNMVLEIGAILGREVRLPEFAGAAQGGVPTEWKVSSKTAGCPHFLLKPVGKVTIRESPVWIRELLRASGVHSINNVVDISNLVMLETGQPMHFYDIDAIPAKEITVMDGFTEGYTALDGVTYGLVPSDLVITTEGKPIGIAGIMGGDDSKILETTRGIAIECAVFDHVHIRNTARRLNLNTEASQRYQKGIEPKAAQKALDRAVQLLKEYADADQIEETVEYGSDNWSPSVLTCTLEQLNDRLGTDFTQEEVQDVFERLHFEPVYADGVWTLTMPSHRTDMEGLADLSEEVIRLIGYDRLPSTLPLMPMTEGKLDERQRFNRLVKNLFCSNGFNEAVTYTLISADKKEDAVLPADEAVKLASGLSAQREYIRTSILPSLLESFAFNKARKAEDLALFEVSGLEGAKKRDEHVAFVMDGALQDSAWNRVQVPADFYSAKGIVEELLDKAGINPNMVRFEQNVEDTVHFHPGRSAVLKAGKNVLGIFGQIHPSYARKMEVPASSVMGELDMSALSSLKKSKVRFKAVSRFPAVQRDAALVLDQDVPAGLVREIILQNGRLNKETVVQDAEIFDVYQGSHIEDGKKSLAVRICFQSQLKTLTDAEIQSMMDKILAALEKRAGAVLR